jgi:hypothetical protein
MRAARSSVTTQYYGVRRDTFLSLRLHLMITRVRMAHVETKLNIADVVSHSP